MSVGWICCSDLYAHYRCISSQNHIVCRRNSPMHKETLRQSPCKTQPLLFFFLFFFSVKITKLMQGILMKISCQWVNCTCTLCMIHFVIACTKYPYFCISLFPFFFLRIRIIVNRQRHIVSAKLSAKYLWGQMRYNPSMCLSLRSFNTFFYPYICIFN